MLKVRPACILAGSRSADKAAAICNIINNESKSDHLFSVPISSPAKSLGKAIQLGINHALQIDSKRPGSVLFTSGTSGPPKGVVLPRASFHFGRNPAEPGSVTLGYKGAHWWTGCRKALEPVLSGKKLYHIGETAGAQEILEALRTYQITTVGFIPAVLHDMKEHILANPPVESWSSYFKGLLKAGVIGISRKPKTREDMMRERLSLTKVPMMRWMKEIKIEQRVLTEPWSERWDLQA